ncbi:hypothetical protein F5884DRAFT_795796 [Xylogone sp. PMI_703]|nr:hypothetical protein F5884DRAFT_795796 [Xylogone sp. PMI_703]
MINSGLHVQLYLTPVTLTEHSKINKLNEEYYIILDFYQVASVEEKQCSAMLLVALGSDQYARVQADTLSIVPRHLSGELATAEAYRYIYAKQHPINRLPDIVVSHRSPKFVEVHPDTRWHRETRTLLPETLREHGIIGLFRYQKHSGQYMDIFVGISPREQGHLALYCWCHQCYGDISIQRLKLLLTNLFN